jgi:hypothetical protein
VQLASILGKKIELELKNRIEEANSKNEQENKAKTVVGPRNITDELYGGSMLQKRNRWEGSLFY